MTAGSELARNILRHANGSEGVVVMGRCASPQRPGVHAVFSDHGPGIADLDAAMRDGYSTTGSLGLGLPGSRRLVDAFHTARHPAAGPRW